MLIYIKTIPNVKHFLFFSYQHDNFVKKLRYKLEIITDLIKYWFSYDSSSMITIYYIVELLY